MLEWLKNVVALGGRLPESVEVLLAAQLQGLDAFSSALAARALDFVRTGDPAAVLERLAAMPDAARVLKLKAVSPMRIPDRRELFRALPPDPALHLRLALLYEAASRQAPGDHLDGLGDELPRWLRVWLWEAGTFCVDNWASSDRSWTTHALLEGMLALAGAPRDLAVRAALAAEPNDWKCRLGLVVAAVPGVREACERNPSAVAEALAAGDARDVVRVLELLARERVDVSPHLARLAELAASAAKTARAGAMQLLRDRAEPVDPLLRALVEGGAPAVRGHAAEALWALRGEAARAYLEARREAERAPAVKRAIEGCLASGGPAPDPELPAGPANPPPPVDVRPGPVSPAVREGLRGLFDAWHRGAHDRWEKVRAHHPQYAGDEPQPVLAAELNAIVRYLEQPGPGRPRGPHDRKEGVFGYAVDELGALAAHPDLGLVALVRLLAVLGLSERSPGSLDLGHLLDRYVQLHRARAARPYGLREVADALALAGIPGAALGRYVLFDFGRRSFRWEADAVWPYFQEHPEPLEEALGMRRPSANRWESSRALPIALEVLAAFPRVPEPFLPRLWELALGSARGDREAAQAALAREPGTRARVVAALGDGRWETRAVAAQWLADLRDPAATAALEAALRKEKHDGAKAALMGALEALGVEVDRFLDRPGLAKEAAKALAKGLPPALAPLRAETLPRPRWADTGEELAPEVLELWLLQCHKLKSPEPSAVLRRYVKLLDPAGREALGKAVLERWIAEDLRLGTDAEVDAAARAHLARVGAGLQGAPGQQFAFARSIFAENPIGSATAVKGVLALVAACAGAAAAPLVQSFLDQWYGMRAAQCKALLRMLSWVDHPSAIQVVLATAARFRTAGIREEAEECARAIAERRGWTVADLADRTMPTAGFGEDGTQALDCGRGRIYTARLTDELAIELTSPEGKKVASVPEPKVAEGEAPSPGRAALAAAKKELKATGKLQGERLYEAMCTGRTWSAGDWDRYLHRHPVASRLARRLVWEAWRGEARLGGFRPLGDGTLTGPADDAFTLPEDATVRLAHAVTTPEDERQGWIDHLASYEIAPLFDQLSRPPRLLPAGGGERRSIDEFRGHLVTTFKLRARATKLRYQRGSPEDGGWFFFWRKHFPTLGIEAQIRFTGSSLPEEDRPAALEALSFRRTSGEGGGAREETDLALAEVPAVLLSECWNDLAAMAADGTGYDPEWEKKVEP